MPPRWGGIFFIIQTTKLCSCQKFQISLLQVLYKRRIPIQLAACIITSRNPGRLFIFPLTYPPLP